MHFLKKKCKVILTKISLCYSFLISTFQKFQVHICTITAPLSQTVAFKKMDNLQWSSLSLMCKKISQANQSDITRMFRTIKSFLCLFSGLKRMSKAILLCFLKNKIAHFKTDNKIRFHVLGLGERELKYTVRKVLVVLHPNNHSQKKP